MQVRELWNWGTAVLAGELIDNARLDAQLLLEHVLGISRACFLANLLDEVGQDAEKRYRTLIAKRAQGVPLQYLVGKHEFMGLPFCVNRHVLIPRPDTEVLVELVLAYAHRLHNSGRSFHRIVDVGTGSGAIAVSLAYYLPWVRVAAVDVSPKALEVARYNAEINGVADRIEFVQSDMLQALLTADVQPYHAVVSNPPYIPSAEIVNLQREVQHEPRLALDGGEDGLHYYRVLARQAPQLLASGGLLAVEIGAYQAESVVELFSANGFGNVKLERDLANRPRVVWGVKKVIGHGS